MMRQKVEHRVKELGDGELLGLWQDLQAFQLVLQRGRGLA